MKKNPKTSINYAAPGSKVGLQANDVVITGGIQIGQDGGIKVGGISLDDDDDET